MSDFVSGLIFNLEVSSWLFIEDEVTWNVFKQDNKRPAALD